MNAAQTAKYLAWFEKHKDVMKAFAMGEEVQYSRVTQIGGDFTWSDISAPSWDWTVEYRVKPKPLDFYVVLRNNGDFVSINRTREAADTHCNKLNQRTDTYIKQYQPYRSVTLREVME